MSIGRVLESRVDRSSRHICPSVKTQWTPTPSSNCHSNQRKCVKMGGFFCFLFVFVFNTNVARLGLSPNTTTPPPPAPTHTHTYTLSQHHYCCCSPAGTERAALMLVEAKKSAGIAWSVKVVSSSACCKHILGTLEIMLIHLEQKHLSSCKSPKIFFFFSL